MSTIYNAVAGAATTVKDVVVGKDETVEQAEKSGTEPKAGVEGAGTSAVEPYDKGNIETPLRSPTSPNPLDLPSAAAHTDAHPTSTTSPLAANAAPAEAGGDASAAEPAPAAALADAAANVKADSGTDPSGPKVGNAQVVEELDAKQKETAPAAASTGVTSPAEAEKTIHTEAKKEDAEINAAQTAGAAVEKKEEKKNETKEKAEGTKETAKEKAEEVKEKVTGPSTPKKSGNEVEASPARTGSTKSDKKKLSTRLKEKLHIGSKKSEP